MSVRVGVAQLDEAVYPDEAPYHPSELYPEYPFSGPLSARRNHVYSGIRRLFQELGYDGDKFDKPSWNPLGFLIEPGMTVVLKPNFVRSRHFEGKDPFSMITHPSVLRALADYVRIALKGTGKIIIADAPQYDANWSELIHLTQLNVVQELFDRAGGPSFQIQDLRNYWSRKRHFPSMLIPLPGDPNGVLKVDLGINSAVSSVKNSKQLYGAVYHRQELINNHSGERHAYEVSGTVLKADVVISVPKLKTHKKVGVTMNIKGLVGACTNKNLIVHYSIGREREGGDQYPPGHFTPLEENLIRTERWMYDTFLAKQNTFLEYVHRSIYWVHGRFIKPLGIGVPKEKRLLDVGNWYGNDSAWRMCVDLHKIIQFADGEGRFSSGFRRRLFSVIDGVVGGENKGPLEPDPVASGLLIAGEDFLATDIVATRLMGFDPMKVRTLRHLLDEQHEVKSYEDISVVSSNEYIRGCLNDNENRFANFRPYPGWVGHIEI
jgi:uncharacterized protein (DUF362 family)